jgi:hypothetical protein
LIDISFIVDDRFPCSGNCSSFSFYNLSCGYSKNVGELWVSIIEKAFYKLFYSGYSSSGNYYWFLLFLYFCLKDKKL